jgi:aminomethyltransferase
MTAPFNDVPTLKRTPLYQLHLALGAKMVAFAGYEMPLQYPTGILKEHLYTRSSAGLFDVSHMGQLVLRPRRGGMSKVRRALESLVPVDVLDLGEGRQRYGLLTNAQGGILDDLMIANRGDHLSVVVNAACKEADEAHLRAHLSNDCTIESLSDRALLALQGAQSASALTKLAPEVSGMRFMDVRTVELLGVPCDVSRSGYTGEDGFEISVSVEHVGALAHSLLNDPAVAPIGLGARDSLRLEAGLCLYGSDLNATTTPVEAALEWAIQKPRRAGGSRSGGFPGSELVLSQLRDGATRRRVGLRPHGRLPVRAGAKLFDLQTGETPVGTVTSGAFGPTVNGPVAMGYVDTPHAKPGTELHAEIRGNRIALSVCDLPFVPARYKRN